MPAKNLNDVRIYYEMKGVGDTAMVLVHGSWVSHHDWDEFAPRVADSFRVVTYDRRGHSDSERPDRQGNVREDVADLAALIEELNLAPAWIVGNSFGASIALRLAGDRPDLLRGLIAHEPPLMSVLADDPASVSILEAESEKLEQVADDIAAGDHAKAAERFVDKVALGPGSWLQLPARTRNILIENAPTFLDEVRDGETTAFDPHWFEHFDRPVLLTKGETSPPMFSSIIEKVGDAIPDAELVTLDGVGHIPHVTHPRRYSETVSDFVRRMSSE